MASEPIDSAHRRSVQDLPRVLLPSQRNGSLSSEPFLVAAS
jgi:hypothetical protein